MIQAQAQRNKYLQTAVQTASPAQLLIMLYDGAIRFCKLGIEAIRQKNYMDANKNLIKAQGIICEFMITLDKSSPFADNLMPLYEYFTSRLIEANTKKVLEPAEEVLGYLTELRETWIQVAKTASSTKIEIEHG